MTATTSNPKPVAQASAVPNQTTVADTGSRVGNECSEVRIDSCVGQGLKLPSGQQMAVGAGQPCPPHLHRRVAVRPGNALLVVLG